MASTAKVDIDANFRILLAKLVAANATLRDSILSGGISTWFKPRDNVDTLDLSTIGEAFSRESLGSLFREVVAPTAGAPPGRVADLISILTQGDFMATAERAYRNRHMTSTRMRLHAAARARGHADSRGVLALGAMSYIQSIHRQGRG